LLNVPEQNDNEDEKLFMVQQDISELEKVEADATLVHEGDDSSIAEPLPSMLRSSLVWRILAKLVMSLHFTAYATALAVFLPAPLEVPDDNAAESSINRGLGHGLGLSVKELGLITTIVALLGCLMQLLLFPRLHKAHGSLGCLRIFLPFSTVTYVGLMFLSHPPRNGILRWVIATVLLCFHGICRTVSHPSGLMMINDASDDDKERAKIHSITHSYDSAVAALGLFLGGILLRAGIKIHFVGLVWLLLGATSVTNMLIVWKIQREKVKTNPDLC
jgi:hypothetical protein